MITRELLKCENIDINKISDHGYSALAISSTWPSSVQLLVQDKRCGVNLQSLDEVDRLHF